MEKSNQFMPIDELNEKVLSSYPYDVNKIIPVKFKDTDKQRAVYRIETDNGTKCLKKVYYDENVLLFIYSIMEWYYHSGIKVPRILPTYQNSRYVKYKKYLFILTDWIEGRKCDYDLDLDICKAAENLGLMHKSSYGFKPISGCAIQSGDCNWYKIFNKRFQQLIHLYNIASKKHDDFSKIFIHEYDYFFNRGKKSVELLCSIDSNKLSEPVKKFNTLCHLDYVNKNIIFTDDGSTYVIDFDKSRIDMPIHDIGTFLKRILKRKNTNWSFDILLLAIENYEKKRVLDQNEILGVYAFLEFPQKFLKISKDYYSSPHKINKDFYLSEIKKICSQKDEHNFFCHLFEYYIKNR